MPRILNNRLRAQPWKIKYPVVHRRRLKLSTPSRPPSPQRLHISNFLPLGLGYTLFPRAFLFSNNSLIASSIGGLRCLPSICFPREFMVSQISGNYKFQALCQWAFNRRSAITRALITLELTIPSCSVTTNSQEKKKKSRKTEAACSQNSRSWQCTLGPIFRPHYSLNFLLSTDNVKWFIAGPSDLTKVGRVYLARASNGL